MLRRKSGRSAQQARLRVGDELDRDARHHLRVAALEAEALAEARLRQNVAQLEAEPAGQDHRARAVRQGIVSDEAAERMAEAVDGRRAQAVLAGDAAFPDGAVVERLGLALFERRDGLV